MKKLLHILLNLLVISTFIGFFYTLLWGEKQLSAVFNKLKSQSAVTLSVNHLQVVAPEIPLGAMDAIINAAENEAGTPQAVAENMKTLDAARQAAQFDISTLKKMELDDNEQELLAQVDAAFSALNGHLVKFIAAAKENKLAELAAFDGQIDETAEQFRQSIQKLQDEEQENYALEIVHFEETLAKLTTFLTIISITLLLTQTIFVTGLIRSSRAQKRRQSTMDRLITAFNEKASTAMMEVSDAAKTLQQAAVTMSDAVINTNLRATSITQTVRETAENVQAVANAIEQMSGSVKAVAENVTISATVVKEAVATNDQADKSAKELQETSSEISKITDLIKTIATQINLLALNASIESAHAGEAGKGFAVVANEVKGLASRTSSATADISKQILSIQDVTLLVVDSLEKINAATAQINENFDSIRTAANEQFSVTASIADNMQVASKGVINIETDIAEVNDAARNADVVSRQVLSSAESLSRQSDYLRNEIEGFLTEIKAA